MIIKPTYFKNEIYLPHSVPSVSDEVLEVESEIQAFINEYEEEALIKLLGVSLAHEFMNELDETELNGLEPTAHIKWDNLLNGHLYYKDHDMNNPVSKWKGLRFKSRSQAQEPDKSLLAYYIYYYYESNSHITRSDVGNQIEIAKNAERILPTQKVIKAWRKFVKMAQGGYFERDSPVLYMDYTNRVVGVDYYGNTRLQSNISLYEYISDINDIAQTNAGVDEYENFNPTIFGSRNQFGI